jgi:hypothetical protein
MISVVKIAAYICQRYHKEFGGQIDEMKLHKLLYFMQRECLSKSLERQNPRAQHENHRTAIANASLTALSCYCTNGIERDIGHPRLFTVVGHGDAICHR